MTATTLLALEALGNAATQMDVAAGVLWSRADGLDGLHNLAADALRNSAEKLKHQAECARVAIAALEADIARAVEPVAEICDYERCTDDDGRTLQYALIYALPDTEKLLPGGTKLYAAPQEPATPKAAP